MQFDDLYKSISWVTYHKLQSNVVELNQFNAIWVSDMLDSANGITDGITNGLPLGSVDGIEVGLIASRRDDLRVVVVVW